MIDRLTAHAHLDDVEIEFDTLDYSLRRVRQAIAKMRASEQRMTITEFGELHGAVVSGMDRAFFKLNAARQMFKEAEA